MYKPALGPVVAKSMVEAEAGKHFDAVLGDAFRERFEDFLVVRAQWSGAEKDLVST